MRYDFDWDDVKAKSNVAKHSVSFEKAATIFRDPNLLSIPDVEHSVDEDRWITMGIDEDGNLVVLVHTFESSGASVSKIRIISARKATKRERVEYEKGI